MIKKIQELQQQIIIHGDSNNINSPNINNTTINLNIQIQPIQRVSIHYNRQNENVNRKV